MAEHDEIHDEIHDDDLASITGGVMGGIDDIRPGTPCPRCGRPGWVGEHVHEGDVVGNV